MKRILPLVLAALALPAGAATLDTSAFAKTVDLAKNRFWINHDAAGDNRLDFRTEHAARNKGKLIFLAVKDNGMTRVRAALITDDDLVLRSEKIDDLTFRLVAPL